MTSSWTLASADFSRPISSSAIHVHAEGWSGTKNGALLKLADQAFDALVTMDKHLIHQQNLSVVRLGIVVVRAASNRRQDIEPLLTEIVAALRAVKPAQVLSLGPLAGR